MKNLSSLTTFFIAFLCVVYWGVFTGSKINGFTANKKIVLVDTTPAIPDATSQPVNTIQPTPKPSAAALAQAPKAQVPATQSQSTPAVPVQTSAPQVPVSAPIQTSAPAINPTPLQPPPPAVNTPPPVASEPTLPPAPPPPPAPTDPPPAPPPPSDRCIITISGGNYDVTDYRNIHSGGNVFQCGTDMTASFLNQHPASFLQKMSKYQV
ncbi:hypothetical protein HYU95_00835 [Candidatus Daviesbacteria bacterium]|nr:hypothetical protein [Candidatus Daviesbacteria bacterium]